MTTISRLGPSAWATLREVRLAALRDAPYAFNASLADVERLAESEWRARIEAQACFVAIDGASAIGLAQGGQLREPLADVRTLRSMWVAPPGRGRGISSSLVDAVVGWARGDGASRLVLWALLPATHAQAFYVRYGFTVAGEHPPDDRHEAMLRYELEL